MSRPTLDDSDAAGGVERTTTSAEAMIQISVIHFMLRRLVPTNPPATFNYRRLTNTTPALVAA